MELNNKTLKTNQYNDEVFDQVMEQVENFKRNS